MKAIRNFIDEVRSFWDYICDGQFGELALDEETSISTKHSTSVLAKPKKTTRDPEDLKTTNLFPGKIFEDGAIKCEVIDVHKTNIHVKILEIKWDRMATYLDAGKIYPVFKHRGWGNGLEVWEIAPKHMKRSTSQVILQWEEGIGWCWDLDF